LRGEFVRGWDGGREVDEGRVFGSKQNGTAVIVDPNRSTVTVCTPINRVDKSGGNLSTNWLDVNNSCEDIGVDHVVNARDTWPNLLNSYQNTTVTSGSAIELHTGGFGTGSARPRNVALLYCIKY
jgi:phage-related tail fiber protein